MNLLSSLILLGSLALTLGCPKPGAVNVARNGVATQESNYTSASTANNAIDGNRETDYMKGSCTHTNGVNPPWWSVDLKQIYRISNVFIYIRGDCCQEWLLGAEIRIGNFPDINNPVCGTVTDVSGVFEKLCCNGMIGRFVTVSIPHPAFLNLCEVEVYGDPVTQSYACF